MEPSHKCHITFITHFFPATIVQTSKDYFLFCFVSVTDPSGIHLYEQQIGDSFTKITFILLKCVRCHSFFLYSLFDCFLRLSILMISDVVLYVGIDIELFIILMLQFFFIPAWHNLLLLS